MIDSIYPVEPQKIAAANETTRSAEKSVKQVGVSSPRRDVYTSGNLVYESEAPKGLTADMALSLAERYDVKNMTRNEYGSLLQELRNSGVISSKDFGVGFGGEVPYTAPDGVRMTMGTADGTGLEPWPSGNGKADFTKLLRACANYCRDFAVGQEKDSDGSMVGHSLCDSYQRLSDILDQIEQASWQKR